MIRCPSGVWVMPAFDGVAGEGVWVEDIFAASEKSSTTGRGGSDKQLGGRERLRCSGRRAAKG